MFTILLTVYGHGKTYVPCGPNLRKRKSAEGIWSLVSDQSRSEPAVLPINTFSPHIGPEEPKAGSEMRWHFLSSVTLGALTSSLKLGPSVPTAKQPGGQARAAFPTCEAAAESCVTHFSDHKSYPNIKAGKLLPSTDISHNLGRPQI